MKLLNQIKKFAFGLVLTSVTVGAATAVWWNTAQPRTLAWDYADVSDVTHLSFSLYSSTNVATPLTNWVKFTNVWATNLTLKTSSAPGLITNTFYFSFLQVPALQFFVVSASNSFYGAESDFSNVTNTPAPPFSPRNTRIQ